MAVISVEDNRTPAQDAALSVGRALLDFWHLALMVLLLAGFVLAGFMTDWRIGAVAAAAALMTVLVDTDFYVSLYHSGSARRALKSHYRDWPQTCDLLGWSAPFKAHTEAKSNVRRVRLPDLLKVERDDDVLNLTIRPLPNQGRKTWPTMADELARLRGVPYQQFHEVSAGVINIELISRSLPTLIDFNPFTDTSSNWDEVIFARDPLGRPIFWKLSDIPHILIAGSTNGGKGSIIKLAIRHALETGWWVIVANPKGSGEFGWASKLGVPVIMQLDEIERMTQWVMDEMRRRQKIVLAADVDNWTFLPKEKLFPPMMLVFDEVSSTLLLNKANKKMSEQQLAIGGDMATFSMQARSVGIHLAAVAQRPDVNNLGPSGGLLRSNLDARVVVCNIDNTGLNMMFEGSDDPDIDRHLDGTKGRALFSRLNAAGFDVYPGQVFYLPTEDLIESPPNVLIPQLADPKVVDLDIPFAGMTRMAQDATGK